MFYNNLDIEFDENNNRTLPIYIERRILWNECLYPINIIIENKKNIKNIIELTLIFSIFLRVYDYI